MNDLRLGKQPAIIDSRTLKLSTILRILPPLPAEYDLDKALNLHDDRMFLNDVLGDCVIAGRAHQTMRFEKFEQGATPVITDDEVKAEYLKETDGKDSGLVMLNSLNAWRHDGWKAAGKQYGIHAFTSINWKSHGEVMAVIYLLGGIYCGLMLPISAQAQIANRQTWDVSGGPEGIIGSWGGHAIYVMAYNATGPVCMTWGKRQQMAWHFWDTYCEEAYCVIDNPNKWMTNSPVNTDLLEKQLAEITGSPIPAPVADKPWYLRFWDWIISFFGK